MGEPCLSFFWGALPFLTIGAGEHVFLRQAGRRALNRSEEGHAEVLAEVEALRADLQLMRTQVGSAIGVDLVQP